MLDAGCGSGVIAVAAARLGFAPVIAVDVDPVAVEVDARERRARTASRVDARVARRPRDELPRVDVVVANIELAAVEALARAAPRRASITSGYLAADAPCRRGLASAWSGSSSTAGRPTSWSTRQRLEAALS